MLKMALEETKDYAVELLSIACPLVGAVNVSKKYFYNLSSHILIEKIKTFIENQDSDFDEWLKISCKFQENSAEYNEAVKLLIYTIDSFNDDKKIYVYANLMRAYKCKLINKNTFLRLSSILPIIFFDDLLFLKGNIKIEIVENVEEDKVLTLEASNLLNHNLISCVNANTWGAVGGDRVYRITTLGLEMIRCGIDFDNHDNYKDINVEELVKKSKTNSKNSKMELTE